MIAPNYSADKSTAFFVLNKENYMVCCVVHTKKSLLLSPSKYEVMNFFRTMLVEPSVLQSIVVLTLCIALGLFLAEKLRIKNFSMGMTWILFCGIVFSHFGIVLDTTVGQFAKDFGLVLFVYSLGLQVGPSFFSSFGKGGWQMNVYATLIVLLGCVTTYVIHLVSGEPIATMVGVMTGAVTNTPSMGAAQQAYSDLFGTEESTIASAYAVAYPLAVLGIILTMPLLKRIFRISIDKEEEALARARSEAQDETVLTDVLVTNQQLTGITVRELNKMLNIKMVISRIINSDGHEQVPSADSVITQGDHLRILTDKEHVGTLRLIGQQTERELKAQEAGPELVSRRIVVTKPRWNGKRIGSLHINQKYHVTITRINRAGIDLLAIADLPLQMGDRIMVVGEKEQVKQVADLFGNEMKKLDIPNLIPIFLGIALGVLVGSLPIQLPGLNTPFKLGLAGGTIIVAILIGRYGPYYHLVTFATTSANRMLRETGLCLFLAAVGLGAGESFVPSILAGGYNWILYGILITMLPLLIVGFIARKWGKLNYFSLMGLLAGATNDPPALAYASSLSDENNQPSVAYATVYPLTMFLRVMAAQLMIILLC